MSHEGQEPAIAVHLRYYNILRDATGCTDEVLKVPVGTTLKNILRQVVAIQHPEAGTLLILTDGQVSPYTRFFRNGAVVTESGMDDALQDLDEVRLYPAVAGG